MTANPDALRRAADEMDALITRQAAHLADIERLEAMKREDESKAEEVRADLRRAGFPVVRDDWPNDALRKLVDAHLSLKALSSGAAPITMSLCSLLDDCRPAEIVDRVRSMTFELAAAKGKQFAYHDHLTRLREALDAAGAGLPDGTLVERVRDLARRLEVAELDRAGLVATTDTLRRERDAKSLTIQRCHTALTAAGVRQGTLDDRVAALIGDRAAKPTGPAWDDEYFTIYGARTFWTFELGAPKGVFGVGRVRDNKYVGYATSLDSARRLAELLAGFDPGGIWRVAGSPVTVDVVRAVCPTVAVSWGAA